jgi:integrase
MPKREGGRAGNYMGTVRQKPNGRWEYRFSIKEEDGTSRQKSVSGATQKEAVDRGRKLEEQYRKGLVAKKSGQTFKEFAQEWYNRRAKSGKAENTLKNYRLEMGYAVEHLGGLKLQAIKPSHVRKMLDHMATEGWTPKPTKPNPHPKPRPYTPRTMRKTLERLSSILQEAVRMEIIYRNPCEAITVEAPPSEPKGRTLEPAEIEKLLTVTEESKHPMALLFRLLLTCGLRKSEALALKWKNIDLEAAELFVGEGYTGSKAHFSKPKTKRSRRVVPIPSGLLGRFKAKREELAKDFTPEQIGPSYVFGDMAKGKPFHPTSPNTALQRIAAKHGLSYFRCHDLRHTYGSVMLSQNIPVEVVSERMGHASITITLDTYRHLLEHERKGYVFDVEEVIRLNQRHNA